MKYSVLRNQDFCRQFGFYFSNNSHCLAVCVLFSTFLSQYMQMENKALTVLYSKPSFFAIWG